MKVSFVPLFISSLSAILIGIEVVTAAVTTNGDVFVTEDEHDNKRSLLRGDGSSSSLTSRRLDEPPVSGSVSASASASKSSKKGYYEYSPKSSKKSSKSSSSIVESEDIYPSDFYNETSDSMDMAGNETSADEASTEAPTDIDPESMSADFVGIDEAGNETMISQGMDESMSVSRSSSRSKSSKKKDYYYYSKSSKKSSKSSIVSDESASESMEMASNETSADEASTESPSDIDLSASESMDMASNETSADEASTEPPSDIDLESMSADFVGIDEAGNETMISQGMEESMSGSGSMSSSRSRSRSKSAKKYYYYYSKSSKKKSGKSEKSRSGSSDDSETGLFGNSTSIDDDEIAALLEDSNTTASEIFFPVPVRN